MKRHPSDAICSADLDGSVSYEPQESQDTELTHIVSCHALSLGRGPNRRPQYRALCGSLCEDIQHVAANPSCPDCKTIDAEDEQALLALQQLPAVVPPRVFPKFNDLNRTDGHRRR